MPRGARLRGATAAESASPTPNGIGWAIASLLPPLIDYYASLCAPRDPHSRAGVKLGPKSGGGHGKARVR